MMTSKERIAAALDGRDVDHLPFCPFLAYVWEHFPQEIQAAGQLAFLKGVGADPLWRGAPCPVQAKGPDLQWEQHEDGDRVCARMTTPVGVLEQTYRRSHNANTSFLVEHPLKREEDFKVLLWIEENTSFSLNLEPVNQHLEGEAGREGFSIGMLIPRGKSAFQSLIEHHVGTEELMYALIDYPETVEALWQQMVANDLEVVNLAMAAGYDYFLTWEDSSTQNYSPAQYRKYIGTEIGQWCKILAGAGKRYVQHACGHVRDLVVPMRDSGVYAVESISPPPTGNVTIREARAKVGSAFGIIGGIEPTAFLNRSGAALTSYVEETIAAGRGGPFVLANSDSCPPGVTPAKFKQVADIARATRG